MRKIKHLLADIRYQSLYHKYDKLAGMMKISEKEKKVFEKFKLYKEIKHLLDIYIMYNNNIEVCNVFEIEKFKEIMDWKTVSDRRGLPELFIKTFQNEVDWEVISRRQQLSEEFIREFQDKVDWSNISQFQYMSEDFIRDFHDKMDWGKLQSNRSIYGLSESLMRDFQDEIDWKNLHNLRTHLSEQFILEFSDRIGWEGLVLNKSLNQRLISEASKRINPQIVMENQEISEEWLNEYVNEIDLSKLHKKTYRYISEDFVRKHFDVLNHEHINKRVLEEIEIERKIEAEKLEAERYEQMKNRFNHPLVDLEL